MCGVFLARLKLVRGDESGAAALLAQAEQSVREHDFVHRMPEVVAVQVLMLLRQGSLTAAADLAQQYDLPMSRARVLLSQGNPSTALAVLGPYRQQVEAKNWQDERLKVMVLHAVALHAHGEMDKAVQLLGEALALAEPGGFIRIFVDEGEPMRLLILDFRLWIERQAREGHKPIEYVDKLLAAFAQTVPVPQSEVISPTPLRSGDPSQKSTIIEPLSQRELEILKLIAQGLSNREICARLFLALDTVKGHNRRIFDKLQVQRRTEALARAHELGLL
jgi:LuxR family maltose regulon positive regulatory protein